MRSLRSDEGFTSVTFILMLVVLILAVGAVSADLWHVVAEHRKVAGLVDGAAISAANAIDPGSLRLNPPSVRLQPAEAVVRACRYLQAGGDVSACPGQDVGVSVDVDSVRITLRRRVDLTLLKLLSGLDPTADTSPIEVVATATARAASR